MDLAAEIKRLRSQAGIGSQKELARLVGVSQAFIAQLETGRRKGFSRDVEIRLCHVLGVPPDHFAPFLTDTPRPLRVAARPATAELAVPFKGKIAAGRPIAAAAEDKESSLDLRAMFGRPGLVAYQVRGSSMVGHHIADGDYVVIRPQDEADNGQLVVVCVDGDVTLKRLQIRTRAKHVELLLLPANGAMPPIRVDPERQDVRVLGVLYSVIRRVK